MERKRDRIVFMGSYYDGLIDLDGEDFENVTKALLRYMFCDELPTLTGIQNSLFMSFKANVDISKAKSDSGKKGGMASWESRRSKPEAEPKQDEECLKQNRSTVEAEPQQSRTTRLDKTSLDKTRLDETRLDKTKKGGKRPREEITDPEIRKAFDEFADMRQRMRKPMTVRAEELVLKELYKLSADTFGDIIPDKAVKILEQSTVKGWTTVYPLKDNKQNSQKIDWDSI